MLRFLSLAGPLTNGDGELHEIVVAHNGLEFSIGTSGDYKFVQNFVARNCSQFCPLSLHKNDLAQALPSADHMFVR
jgi:hypothetical protein